MLNASNKLLAFARLNCRKGRFNMSISTIKSADKIKLLDQMLEDIAGDEFDEYESTDNTVKGNNKHYTDMQELEIIELMH